MANTYSCNIDKLFYLLKQHPLQAKEVLINTLIETSNVEYIDIVFDDDFGVNNIAKQIAKHRSWKNTFPTVFISKQIETKYNASFTNKLKLKLKNIPHSISASQNIELQSFTYSNIALYVQMLLYIHENNYADTQTTKTLSYLQQKLGNTYSEGLFTDHIDSVFDMYKHTNISVAVFRNIFRCFGAYTEDVSNLAFDNYSDSRNTTASWSKAIEYFCTNNVLLPNNVANKIATLLVSY